MQIRSVEFANVVRHRRFERRQKARPGKAMADDDCRNIDEKIEKNIVTKMRAGQ